MKTLIFSKPHLLYKLQDELLGSIPELRPVPNERGELEAVITVTSIGDEISLIVPDEIDEATVRSIINKHDLTPPPKSPTTEEKIAQLEQEKLVLQLALAEAIEKQETDKINNQLALAELIETLTVKGVL